MYTLLCFRSIKIGSIFLFIITVSYTHSLLGKEQESTLTKQDIERLLKFGAYDLFLSKNKKKQPIDNNNNNNNNTSENISTNEKENEPQQQKEGEGEETKEEAEEETVFDFDKILEKASVVNYGNFIFMILYSRV